VAVSVSLLAMVDNRPLMIVWSTSSLRSSLAWRVLATVQGNIAGGTGIGGHRKGSGT
jgi:hypothetical protein